MSAPRLSAKATYRPEIQGLRAVASLLVAAYHIWMGRVSGGVDVFFVVSSFLITSSLVGMVEKTGRVNFVKFWGGLIKRLLPIAIFVLVSVVIASVIFLPRVEWDDTIRGVIASALYVENWQLAFNAIDYLAQDRADVSLLQHYWALSIQGQFYLTWPFVVTFAALIAARIGKSFKAVAATVFGTIFVLSLAHSISITNTNQPFAYFDTLARAWEFAIGALLALVLPKLNLPKTARFLAGWVGLIGILSCGLVLHVSQVFPGYMALWPVLSAALIMVGGTSGSAVGADRLLAAKPLVAIGDISYSLYLWHWPLLVFYRLFTGKFILGPLEGVVLIAVALGLAWLSARLLEDRVRYSKIGTHKPWHALAVAPAVLMPLFVLVAGWAYYYKSAQRFDRRPIELTDSNYPGARARAAGFRYTGDPEVPFYPGPLGVRLDVPAVYTDGCQQDQRTAKPLSCVYGDKHSERDVYLVGGSHSGHWLPALDIVAKRNGWRLVTYIKSACLFRTKEQLKRPNPSCEAWNEQVLQILLRERPEVVFTTSTTGSGDDEHVPRGFLNRWEQLAQAGIKVVAVRDTPWMNFNVAQCVELNGPDDPECTRPRAAMLAAVDPAKRLPQKPSNVVFLDLNDYFCTASTCVPTVGNVMIYRDGDHMTATYAKTLAPLLEDQMTRVMPAEWIEPRRFTAAQREAAQVTE